MKNNSKVFKKSLFTVIILSIMPASWVSCFALSKVDPSEGASIEQFKSNIPAAICAAYFNMETTKNALELNKITYEKCVPLMAKSVDRCFNQYSPMMPPKTNTAEFKKWATMLGRCAGGDFYNYNIKKSK